MVTLRDIATRVGVSVSSVSLVLNDLDAGRVSADIAEQIRRVALEMGYAPNLSARGLRNRQTRTIGIVSDRVASVPFAGDMLVGAQSAAWDEGYVLLLIDTAGNPALEKPAVTSLLQRNVEALIFATDFHRTVDVPVVRDEMPRVVLDGRPKDEAADVDWVVPDEAGGAYAATQRLVEAGHRRIAFCNVSSSVFVARSLRRAGYEAALTMAGLPVDPTLVVEADDPSTAAGRGPAEALLSRPDRPTAVFCFSDQLAFGFYQTAQRLGLAVPDDLSIVGFDNYPFIADSILPALTTVQLPYRDMGIWAANKAIARLQGAPPAGASRRLMPCPLVERDSVAAPSFLST